MDIKIEVNPEDVEAAVKEAIIKSSIGQMIERKVKEATNDYNLEKAVTQALQALVASHARDLLLDNTEFAVKIRTKISEMLDDKFIDGVAAKIVRAVEREY